MNETKEKLPKVVIYTDGACRGNPGPGGWGALLICGEHKREIMGGERNTTNNRMELMAGIEALKRLKVKSDVELYTDSSYLKNGIQQWIRIWKSNHWRTAAKKPVKNRELWEELDYQASRHSVRWRWIKGHAGNFGNERADQLANKGLQQIL